MANKITTRAWDAAEHLRDEEDVRLYIEAAQEEAPDDATFMAAVLGDVARSRNIAELARTTGIARETLYKMLRGEGNPTMGSLSKLANALGFRLSLVPIATKPAADPVTRHVAVAVKRAKAAKVAKRVPGLAGKPAGKNPKPARAATA